MRIFINSLKVTNLSYQGLQRKFTVKPRGYVCDTPFDFDFNIHDDSNDILNWVKENLNLEDINYCSLWLQIDYKKTNTRTIGQYVLGGVTMTVESDYASYGERRDDFYRLKFNFSVADFPNVQKLYKLFMSGDALPYLTQGWGGPEKPKPIMSVMQALREFCMAVKRAASAYYAQSQR